jgi:2-aminoethylphosphonate-pyruvate transaminase
MAVSSCLSPGASLLIVQNGVYGERIAKIAECYRLQKQVLQYPWGTPPDLRRIDDTLAANPGIEVVAVVHHETTTGLLNPLREIGEIVRRHKRKLLADCISSLAGDAIDFARAGLDFCVGTANKCIQGYPGVSFVLMRRDEAARLEKIPQRSLYFNLYGHFKAQERGDILFTPAIQAHYALDEALSELLEETVAGRITRYRAAALRLRARFSEMGLRFLIPRELYSNTLTSLKMPDDMTYARLHDGLREKGFVIYAGQGSFNDAIFRVANMGDVRPEEFDRFLLALEECLEIAARK